jgi:hypothetical protein
MRRFKCCDVCLLLMLCLSFRYSYAQHFEIGDNHKRATIPFKIIRDMIIVKIMINDKGPYNFVLDTGVGLMIITQPNLIDSLNIKNKRLIKITGLGTGEDLDAYVTSGLKINIGDNINSTDMSAAIFTKDHFGLENYAGIPIYGLVGYEFFNSFAVKVSFTDTLITVGLPKDIRPFRKSYKLPLTIEDHKPYITANLLLGNGKPMDAKLIVDLGAGHPILLENLVDKNNGLPDKFISGNLGMGINGPISGYLSRIDEVNLGKYKLKNVIASFPDYELKKEDDITVKRDGNLGIDILKRFNMIIDYQSGALYLKPNSNFNTSFEHDMSGLEYYADGKDLKHIIISRVERGSAGDEIGLQKGVSVNFKPVEKMGIEEIDNMFRSRTDRTLLLEIFRDNRYDKVVLTLRRRI